MPKTKNVKKAAAATAKSIRAVMKASGDVFMSVQSALGNGAFNLKTAKGKVVRCGRISRGLRISVGQIVVTEGEHSLGVEVIGVIGDRAEAYAAFKEASEVKQGIAPRFVASYRSEHEAEWDTFLADWNAKHPKLSKEEKAASAAASVASEEEEIASVTSEEVKKRKGPKKLSEMTAEELAAHKARVAAKQAAKAAPTVEEVEAKAAAPFVLAPAPAPAPAAEAPAAEVAEAPAAEVAEAEAEEEASLEARTFTSGGQKYIRLWNTDTESWASGHLWLPKKKGTSLTYGSYVGELMVDGSINPDSDEPEMP